MHKNTFIFIKKYEIYLFLIFAPIINGLFVYGVKSDIIPGRIYLHGRFFLLLFLLMFMVWFTKGREGLRNIFKPMLKWNVPFKWYLLSLFFASIIACLTLLIKALYLGGDYSVFLISTSHVSDPKFMFNLILWAFVGEVVWVSYAVRELSKSMNVFFASQIVGIVWAFWWAPIVWLNVGVIQDLPLWPLIISMMAVAGMCAVMYGQTKSGICVWVLQTMLNTTLVIFYITPSSGGIPTYVLFSILYFLAMLAFMYFLNINNKFKSLKIKE